MNLMIVASALMLSVLTVNAAKSCDNDGECKPGFFCNPTNDLCERQSEAGDPCTFNRQCKGSSNCEEVPGSDLVEKVCTERCRTDTDCEQYVKPKPRPKVKYCTTGGLETLVKGYCLPTKGEGEDCNRSPECEGKLFCKHGTCVEAAEAVTCELDCNGPREKNPNNIKPGDTVKVTYSCTFIRTGEFGPLSIRPILMLNKKPIKLENAQKVSDSPVTISGSRSMVARKGEFSAEIQGMMKACKNHRKLCRASKRCIL
ncbi:unnamed protein product [Owenia fusiformis]|uniref:Uncharacterized protein n=1 Tax=Owenia fusiformis TaxID=6347 RepID=A0A8J1TW06_OWEFU|nr:unnamed protein product [Owenia fusiformis]